MKDIMMLEDRKGEYGNILLTFRADGVMAPGKMRIPREIFFSSRIPTSLGVSQLASRHVQGARGTEMHAKDAVSTKTHLRIVFTPTLFSSEKKIKIESEWLVS
jgi:hypothetical protein